MENIILVNSIQTPDGTVLISRFRHDYQTHIDKTNNKEYFVDGGKSYSRRSNHGDEIDLCVYYKPHDHEHNRKFFTWGTKGKEENQPFIYKAVQFLDIEHIKNILKTQKQIKGTYIEKIFEEELKYREEIKN